MAPTNGKGKAIPCNLKPSQYDYLAFLAKRRGINVQSLIRAVVVPDWLAKNGGPRE